MQRRLLTIVALIIVAAALGACASSRAFRSGEESARVGDWDAAVVYYQKAVQGSPDNAEYKMKLKRAMENAAGVHVGRARELEASDQLDAALREYRKALEYDSTNRIASAKAAELERTIRERVEATRPRPKIEELRERARQIGAPPILNPASREPLKVTFQNASIRDILNFIGGAAGINITYDQQSESIVTRGYTVNLEGVTLEEALDQILAANGLYYKVLNARTIIIIPDTVQKHAQYDELAIKTFYLSNADAAEVTQVLNQVARLTGTGAQPTIMQNKTANTITVRATVPMMEVIERVIRANDKPRAEVLIDVEVLEVSRTRMKQYGLDLGSYSVNLYFSPESPPTTTTPTGGGSGTTSSGLFNLNTISQGIATTDFYLGVPSAVIRFMEQDAHSRVLAKPQLRGAEGTKLTLNLGQEVPVVSTVFGAAAVGGFASIPQSSYTYRNVGVNVEMTPRVTYEGEIILELALENSSLGANISVAGQSVPSFNTRKVTTKLRLREGESNLLAGLIAEQTSNSVTGIPGLVHVPGFKQLFSSNNDSTNESDIVMLLTPHIVRTHELTADDLSPIYIGTSQRIGLTGAPQLIAPQEGTAPAPGTAGPGAGPLGPAGATATGPAGAAGTAATGTPPGYSQPGAPPGVPLGPQAGAAAPGVPTTVRPTVPPGTSPVPGQLPTPGAQPPAAATQTGGGTLTPPSPEAPAAPAPEAAQPAAPPSGGAGQPPAAAAQVIVTPPGTEFRVGGGPYTVPISINGVSRASTITLTLTFNSAVVRARSVQEGSFMRQGGAAPAFTPRIDPGAGRVDVVVARTSDATGASGSGLIAAVLFDAVAAGNVTFTVTGTAQTPEGANIPLTFQPVTVTVR